ncbi:MAG: TIGR04168 family protein, partial [Leptolyngbya sp. SIO1D8]|nr:TIGR04168 family protein [Leptolyngbya sp. SIO1D8]
MRGIQQEGIVDTSTSGQDVRIAIIGDVHNQWDEQDAVALHSLKVDLVLLVGDFGNESVEVVRSIAALDLPKAAVFGNHDAWYTATPWGRRKCPYDRTHEDWVQTQIDLLGEAHVGYGKLDFPALNLTV